MSLSVPEFIQLGLDEPHRLEDPAFYEATLEAVEKLESNPVFGWVPAVSPRDGRSRQTEYLASSAIYKLYAGGNGAGKSTVGTVDDLVQLMDRDAVPPHLQQYKRWEPPVPMRVVVPKMSVIEGATLEAFRNLTPRDQLLGKSFDKAYSQQRRKLSFANGSYVLFNTGDQDRDAHSAVELRRVRFDEEPEGEHGRGIFTENVARLRSFLPDAQICFTMTPLFGLSWVYDTIWERRDDPDVFCVVASMRDNPHINADETIKALSHLSKEEREAVVEGLFVHVSGAVIKIPDDLIVDPISPTDLDGLDPLVGIDPGIRRGGVVWSAFENRQNDMLVFDELYPENLTVPDIAAQIMVKNCRWGLGDAAERNAGRVYFVDRFQRELMSEKSYETVMRALDAPPGRSVTYVIDPSARNRQIVNAENVEGEFARAGIYANHGQNDRRTGVLQLRARLDNRALRVTRNCSNWLFESRRWLVASDEVIAEGKAKVKGADGTFATIGPDHLMDPTRYLAMERLYGGFERAPRPLRERGFDPTKTIPAGYLRTPNEETHPMGGMY